MKMLEDLLHPRHRQRLAFRRRGRGTVAGRHVWKIDFVERARPSLIRTPGGIDQITRGSAWLDGATGEVIRTYLNVVVNPTSQAKIDVDYRSEAKLGLLVPSTMREAYERFSSNITTTATYSNFRQFQTSARILDDAR